MTGIDDGADTLSPTPPTEHELSPLRAAMRGQVIAPGDADYDTARTVWNADIDRRPAAIARCLDADDVSAAVRFATGTGLEIAVRGGAHSMSGASTVDGGLMIDLSQINDVTVDPAARRVRAGGGALLGDIDMATQAHGLAVPAGLISHTGVGGLTLGGGMGWLTRKAGLSIDNLTAATVVTADGQIRRAAAEEHADLFWAIRGGGGNFGVVTEFEFALHEVDPIVQFGLLFWGLDQGRGVLRLAREVIADLPRELNIIIAGVNAPPEPFVPEAHRLQPGYALLVVGFGAAEAHNELLARIRAALPPLFEHTGPMPYVALQQMLDEANAWGHHCYDKSCYVEELTDAAIDVVADQLPAKTSPLSVMLFYRLDEAYCEIGEDETAFGGTRSPQYSMFIIGVCPVPELLPAEREWVRGFWESMRPHTLGIGAYVNGITEPDADRIKAAYGAKYERLTQIKATYDPANVFHRNANIPPAKAAPMS